MRNTPLLSIIISAYRTKSLLIRCLDSVLGCSYRNLDVIIVYDKYQEDIERVIKGYVLEDERVKFVHYDENNDLFHARLKAAKYAEGKYITFLDSDNHVSVDFYRRLIEQAENNNSDIVFGEVILECESKERPYSYHNLSHARTMDIDFKGEDSSKLFFGQTGRDYTLHLVENKIYRRELWEKCVPYFDLQKMHIIICEDVFYSSFLWYFSRHVSNIHGDFLYYSHSKLSFAYFNGKSDKYRKIISDIKHVFTLLKSLFDHKLHADYELGCISSWENLVLRMLMETLSKSKLRSKEKDKLKKSLQYGYGKTLCELSIEDKYFYSVETWQKKIPQENLKKQIMSEDISVVSFDIFDTLIYRPFWEPKDLFYLLGIYVNQLLEIADSINFLTIRVEAESLAREKKMLKSSVDEDVTLDEIYDVVHDYLGVSTDIIEKIKQYEMKLEIKYCQPRKYAKEIYDFALAIGKKVIIVSDMYLPQTVIEKILRKCGYYGYSNLFVSSQEHLTKAEGGLYTKVCSTINVKPEHILHIGDNYDSDVLQARKAGFSSYHFPKAIDRFAGMHPDWYGGEGFKKVFEEPFCLRCGGQYYWYWGLRTMLAVSANKVFDNPYLIVHPDTDFNADPSFLGYYAIGMHLFAVGNWLHQSVRDNGYSHLNFMARDGYLPMKAYEILETVYKNNLTPSYLHLTRSAILPLQLHKRQDLFSLEKNVIIYSQTPEKLFSLLKPVMKPEIYETRKSLMAKMNIDGEHRFESTRDFYMFLEKFSDYIFDEKIAKQYHEKVKNVLKKYFNGKSATFDVGYSCRIESILKKNFGFDITPHYIHVNNDLSLLRAEKNNMHINCFYEYSPCVTGILREFFISKMEPSCNSIFIRDDGNVEIDFKDYNPTYTEKYVGAIIQSAALRYVHDISNIFKEDLCHLHCLREDTSLSLEYFLAKAKLTDRLMFAGIPFEDDMGRGRFSSILDFWNEQRALLIPSKDYLMSDVTLSWKKNDWKRLICLYFINRDYLKRVVKEELIEYPRILWVIKFFYKSSRLIYRKIFRHP